ncbi:MAG: hypothetical protein LBS60_12505 [Deltaproteobacteria bacterium]|jgi:hypothetical protein|nr:hypothetical protein [Deltaproteobacteria bacterium]
MTEYVEYEKDGFKVIYVNDGEKYDVILADFQAGRLEGQLIGSFPERKTWRVTVKDRSYVIKRVAPVERPIKRHIWEIVVGPNFSRLLRESQKARERGCDFIPKVYLAAEKRVGLGRIADSWLIAEFVAGEVLPLGQKPAPDSQWLKALGPLVAKLHGYGLAHGAPHPFNLIKTAQGFGFIDLSFKGPMLVCMASDVLDAYRKWGVIVPVKGWALKIATKLTFWKYSWHLFRRKLKNRFKKASK